MIAVEIGGLMLASALGVALVSVLWPADRSVRDDAATAAPLGFGIGLAVTSALFWLAERAIGSAWASIVLEVILLAALARPAWRRWTVPIPAGGPREGFGGIWAALFVQLAVLAVMTAWRTWAAEPWGDGDAWAIWNMHARLLFRAGEAWETLPGLASLAWTHPDYPLLIPASVARLWTLGGAETPTAPALVSVAFAGATVALLVGVAWRLAGPRAGWVAGSVLVATPFFVEMAAGQHADLPCGFFILAVVALLVVPGAPGSLAVLAGVAAGGAAWTKNEGLMFAAVAALMWLVHLRALTGAGRTAGVRFVVALAVALVPVAVFKFGYAPPNDVVSADTLGRWRMLVDPARWQLILQAMGRDLIGFGQWALVPLPFLGIALAGIGPRAWNRTATAGLGLVGLTVAGFVGAYLVTPHDLRWHLDSSLVRLLLQVWPALLLLWALALPRGEALEAPAGARAARPVWIGANVVVALLVVGLLSRQPAPNELASARLAAGAVSVVPGEGWHEVESGDGGRWVWSEGEASLELHAKAGGGPAPVTLSFTLRALTPREVTIRREEREEAVLWRGRVAEEAQRVELDGVCLDPSPVRLIFASDLPSVPEGPGPGARRLGVAVADVKIE